MKKALIFDIDGTLWDSTRQIADAWNVVIKEKHYDFSLKRGDILSCMGLALPEFAKRLFPDSIPLEDKLELLTLCLERENDYLIAHPGKLYEGVEPTLKELSKKYDLLLLSNCESKYIPTFLESTKLDKYFKDHLCYGDNLLPKHKNIKILKDKGHYDEVIYVGDTEGDEKEAHLAGSVFVFASYGFGKATNPEFIINRFSDLLKIAKW